MPRLGEEIRFTPAAFLGEASARGESEKMQIPRTVTGRVEYINRPHRYFTAVFTVNARQLRESFKF